MSAEPIVPALPRRRAPIAQLPIAQLQDALLACMEQAVDNRLRQIGLLDRMTPRGLRIAAGLRLEDAAARTGGLVTGATLSHYENGKTLNPDPEKVAAIAAALGIAPKEYRAAVGHLISLRELREHGQGEHEEEGESDEENR